MLYVGPVFKSGGGGGGRYGNDESSKPPLSGRTAFRTGQDLPIAYRSELRLGVGWLSLWGTHTDGSRSVPLPFGAWCSLRSLLGRPLPVLPHPRTREPAGVLCSCASDPPEGAGAAVPARSGPGVGDRSTGAGPSPRWGTLSSSDLSSGKGIRLEGGGSIMASLGLQRGT